MSCDLMFSVPWECGDRDCKVQWHLAGYWVDDEIDTGYTVDNYSDGDHDAIEESELPSFEEQEKSWREYYRYVLRSGTDPLEQFIIKHSVKKSERWQFRVNNSIIGVVLTGARHAGREYVWHKLPDYVKQYLRIENSARLGDFADFAAFNEALPHVKPLRWFVCHINHDAPRPAARVAKELKTAARKAIREARIA